MLSGFPELGEDDEDGDIQHSKLVQDMNRKKKKSGGFQVFNIENWPNYC